MSTFAHCIQRLATTLACSTPLLAAASGPAHGASTAPTQTSVWQHQQVSFTYFGITARYTCSGIEEAVKQLLLYPELDGM